MLETLIIVLIFLLLLPSKDRKAKKKKKSRPWYDISYDDMIMYDIFDDD